MFPVSQQRCRTKPWATALCCGFVTTRNYGPFRSREVPVTFPCQCTGGGKSNICNQSSTQECKLNARLHFKTGKKKKNNKEPNGLIQCSPQVRVCLLHFTYENKPQQLCVTQGKPNKGRKKNQCNALCHTPGCTKDWKYKGLSNFCISSTVWKAMREKPNQTQTQLPSRFGQCKNPGGFQWCRVRKQLQGPGQWGDSELWAKIPVRVAAQWWSCSYPWLSLPLKKCSVLCWLKKQKTPLSIPKGHQKAIRSATQRFPIAFWAVQPYLVWMTRLALSFLTNLQMDLLSPQILRTVTLTLSP